MTVCSPAQSARFMSSKVRRVKMNDTIERPSPNQVQPSTESFIPELRDHEAEEREELIHQMNSFISQVKASMERTTLFLRSELPSSSYNYTVRWALCAGRR